MAAVYRWFELTLHKCTLLHSEVNTCVVLIQTIYTQLPSKSFSKNCVKLPCLCTVTPVDGSDVLTSQKSRVPLKILLEKKTLVIMLYGCMHSQTFECPLMKGYLTK